MLTITCTGCQATDTVRFRQSISTWLCDGCWRTVARELSSPEERPEEYELEGDDIAEVEWEERETERGLRGDYAPPPRE